MYVFLYYIPYILTESITKSSFSSAPVMSDSSGDMRKGELTKEVSTKSEGVSASDSKSFFGSMDKTSTDLNINNGDLSRDTKDMGAQAAEDTLSKEINAEIKAVHNTKSEKNHNLLSNNALVAIGDESTKSSVNINKIIQGLAKTDEISGNLYKSDSFVDGKGTLQSNVAKGFGINGGGNFTDLEGTKKFNGLDENVSINGTAGGGGVLRGGGFGGVDLMNSEKEGDVSINGTSYLESKGLKTMGGGGTAFESTERINKDSVGRDILAKKNESQAAKKDEQAALFKKVVEKETERKIDLDRRSFSEFTGDNKLMAGGLGFKAISGEGYASSRMNTIDKVKGFESYMKTSNSDINEMIKNMHKIHQGNDNTNYLAGKAVLSGSEIKDSKDPSVNNAIKKLAAAAGFIDWQEYLNEERKRKSEQNKLFFGQQFFAGNYADFFTAALKRRYGKEFNNMINGISNKPWSFFPGMFGGSGMYYDEQYDFGSNNDLFSNPQTTSKVITDANNNTFMVNCTKRKI